MHTATPTVHMRPTTLKEAFPVPMVCLFPLTDLRFWNAPVQAPFGSGHVSFSKVL